MSTVPSQSGLLGAKDFDQVEGHHIRDFLNWAYGKRPRTKSSSPDLTSAKTQILDFDSRPVEFAMEGSGVSETRGLLPDVTDFQEFDVRPMPGKHKLAHTVGAKREARVARTEDVAAAKRALGEEESRVRCSSNMLPAVLSFDAVNTLVCLDTADKTIFVDRDRAFEEDINFLTLDIAELGPFLR